MAIEMPNATKSHPETDAKAPLVFPADKDTLKISVNGHTYFIKKIPALKAQKMMIKYLGALMNGGGIAALPDDALNDILYYAGAYKSNGAEVRFEDEDTIEMLQVPLEDLFEIEASVVEANFGFFANGGISRIVERLTSIFAKTPQTTDTPES